MPNFMSTILPQPRYLPGFCLLLFIAMALISGPNLIHSIQAAAIAAALFVATRTGPLDRVCASWWALGSTLAGITILSIWLALDQIAMLYGSGFILLAVLMLRWKLLSRTNQKSDLFLVSLGVAMALAASPPTISRVSVHLTALAVPAKFTLQSAENADRYHKASRGYALHDFHGCGLARTVRAEQAETDALLNGEGHVVDGQHAGIALDQVSGFQGDRHDGEGAEKALGYLRSGWKPRF